jgi:hypothetical protein
MTKPFLCYSVRLKELTEISDADELLRLKQITGLAALFKNKDFSLAHAGCGDLDVARGSSSITTTA